MTTATPTISVNTIYKLPSTPGCTWKVTVQGPAIAYYGMNLSFTTPLQTATPLRLATPITVGPGTMFTTQGTTTLNITDTYSSITFGPIIPLPISIPVPTLGTLSNKIALYDSNNHLLGYVPIFDSL